MQISRLSTAPIKIHQIPHVIFGTKSHFFFRLCITLQCHETKLFCTFSSKFVCFGQMYPIKVQIFGLSTTHMKINRIPYIIFQATSQFPFKPCNALQCHDTYLLWNFLTEKYMLWTKTAHQCTIFRLLFTLMKVHPTLHAIFETTSLGFIQILHICSVSWKITTLCFFSSNLIYFGQK